MDPKLSLTVMATFHDDPSLVELLESHKTDRLVVDGGVPGEANGQDEEDDYLEESFDGTHNVTVIWFTS